MSEVSLEYNVQNCSHTPFRNQIFKSDDVLLLSRAPIIIFTRGLFQPSKKSHPLFDATETGNWRRRNDEYYHHGNGKNKYDPEAEVSNLLPETHHVEADSMIEVGGRD